MKAMLKVLIAPVTPFQQNCSIVWCEETMEGTAVDPGGDFDMLKEAIAENGIKVTKVLLTHGHVDHASAAGTMAEHYGVKIEGPHKDDLFLIEGLPASGKKYNFPAYKPFVPDRWLTGGETVSLGNQTFDVVHCPGHTPAMSCSCIRKRRSPSSATCCSGARSAAQIFRAAITISC